ncbi:hypothetical protein EXS74_01800 [Candidatus Woesearchaeota archaeon]|nr:hypothetical protein [Candidatus Woesearchaeota archaeon]
MTTKPITASALHKLPKDVEKALTTFPESIKKWNSLTPIARNEWICWTTIVKKTETRKEHIDRLCTDLLKGKKRPCCWPGCPHRKPNAKKWFK